MLHVYVVMRVIAFPWALTERVVSNLLFVSQLILMASSHCNATGVHSWKLELTPRAMLRTCIQDMYTRITHVFVTVDGVLF